MIPRTRYFLILGLTFLLGCKKHDIAPVYVPVWQPSTTFATYRTETSSFSIGTKAYFGFGFGSDHKIVNPLFFNDLWEYNTVTETWKELAKFPGEGRGTAAGFAINGKGYIALGYSLTCPAEGGLCDFNSYKDIWEYNPSTDAWTKVVTIDELYDTRYAQVMVINGKAYIVCSSNVYEFDPTTYTVVKKAPAYEISPFGGTFTLNNKGYMFLGDAYDNGKKRVYEYDPVTDQWTKKNDFPGEDRGFPLSFSLDGYGYCGAGFQYGNPYKYFKDFWRYDPSKDQWMKLEDYPGKGSVMIRSAVVGNKAIIGLGEGYENGIVRTNDFWHFQPK